jgi:hypothetical protein
MRKLISWEVASITLSLLLAGALSPAFSDSAASDQSPTLNLDIRGKAVGEAIKTLFDGTGLKYILIQTQANSRKIDLLAKGVTLNSALDLLTRQNGLKYDVKDGVYVITPVHEESASGPKQTESTQAPASALPAAAGTPPAKPTPVEEAAQVPEQQPQDYYVPPEELLYGGYRPFRPYPETYQIGAVTFTRGWPTLTFGGQVGYQQFGHQPYIPYQLYQPYTPLPRWGRGLGYGY